MAEFTLKDPDQIRDDMLRTLRNGLISRGVADPQLGPASHEYVFYQAIADQIAVVNANVQIKADELMPDTATGTSLVRVAATYGVYPQAAAPSEGFVTLKTSQDTFIAAGTQLVDQLGVRFQVTVGGTYTNTYPNNQVPVRGVDTGKQTNHEADDVLKWVTQPAYADPKAIVSAAGLTGGVDADGDEELRARLLFRLQNPPNDANWSQVAALATKSHTSVTAPYVYPAANGPSTLHVAVVGAAQNLTSSITTLNSTSKNRDIQTSILDGTIRPYIQGHLPEYVETIVTTVNNVTNNVGIGLSLPASPAAVPAGPGGGWIDGTPWPNQVTYADVIAVASSTQFTVRAPTAPTKNVTHICFLDPTNWKLYRAKVIDIPSFTDGVSYEITIDAPFPNIAIGNFIWPDCTNAQTYVDAILAAFAAMGPGEKVSSSGNLTRGYRHPLPSAGAPHTLGATQLRVLSNAGSEIQDVQWLYKEHPLAPDVPASVNDAPNIYVPKQIGFYPL